MPKEKKIPLRKSLVSGETIDKRDLLRIVKTKEGDIFIDPTGKKNGRGAILSLTMMRQNRQRKNRSLIVASQWKSQRVFTMN
ncbi:hypothetical protein NC01_03925 [Streptococcus uberis]|nr:hypothetical protein NC01_03925 [Streptococcus uberis]